MWSLYAQKRLAGTTSFYHQHLTLMLIHIYLLSAIIIHRNLLLIAFISKADDKRPPVLPSY